MVISELWLLIHQIWASPVNFIALYLLYFMIYDKNSFCFVISKLAMLPMKEKQKSHFHLREHPMLNSDVTGKSSNFDPELVYGLNYII